MAVLGVAEAAGALAVDFVASPTLVPPKETGPLFNPPNNGFAVLVVGGIAVTVIDEGNVIFAVPLPIEVIVVEGPAAFEALPNNLFSDSFEVIAVVDEVDLGILNENGTEAAGFTASSFVAAPELRFNPPKPEKPLDTGCFVVIVGTFGGTFSLLTRLIAVVGGLDLVSGFGKFENIPVPSPNPPPNVVAFGAVMMAVGLATLVVAAADDLTCACVTIAGFVIGACAISVTTLIFVLTACCDPPALTGCASTFFTVFRALINFSFRAKITSEFDPFFGRSEQITVTGRFAKYSVNRCSFVGSIAFWTAPLTVSSSVIDNIESAMLESFC